MDDFREILEFAIRSEVEAKEYYQGVAAKTGNEMVKKLFLEFAEEEIKHGSSHETVRKNSLTK
ncbi:MAG: ferritin family protein [Desulfobulbus sp.]|jgi:rubrerythrin